jgi:Ca2+-binding RTX toxin-like protein
MAFNLSALTAKQQAAAIYIGYYDRAPDPYGMDFWEAAVANPVVPLVDIATYFAAQEETYAVHPFFVEPSAAAANAFISELYLNLFNRTPDTAGLEFWSTVLQGSIAGTNGFSVGEIILEIIQGAQNTAAGQDITTLLNKIEVANAWTAGAIEAGLTEPNSYGDSEIAQNSAKSIINDVTSDASSVAAAKAVITTAFDGLFPGVTVDLTPNADIVELTRGSDTVTGVVLELSIGDTIIDPSTTDADVLNVELIENIASNVTVQNIETVVLNALSGEREIRVTNWDGVQTYQVIGEGDVILTDVQTTEPSYEFNGTVGTNITVGINDLATTGLADEISVELSNGVAGGTFTLTPATTVETIRLISNGTAENVITDVVGANVRTLIIEGDAAIENTNAFASTITTIDARYVSTADIHSAGATTILTGAGNDLVTLDSALTNSSAIVMGAGTDTLHLGNSTGGAQAELLGMEFIKTLDGGATNIDMAKATATPEFNVAGGSTGITLSNLINGTSLRTSELSTSGDINIGYRNSATDAVLVVDLATQHNAADDAITFTNISDVTLNVQNGLYAVGGGAAPTVTLDDTSLAAGVVSDVVKSVTINNIGVATNGTDNVVLGNVASSSRLETLNLNATGAAVTVGTIAEAESLTSLNIDSTGGEVTVGAIGGTAASTGLASINVTATEDVFLGAVAANNVGGVTDVTLAAANGDITGLVLTNDAGSIDTVTLSGGGAIAATFNTVLLGSGTAGYTKAINSTNTGSTNLTVSNAKTSGAGTVVTLGDGSNTVTLLSSMNDVVTGGAGADTVFVGTGANGNSGTNTINLGAGTDVLSFDLAGTTEAAGIIINVGSGDAFLNGKDGSNANSDEIVVANTAYARSNDDGNVGSGMVTNFSNVERFVGTDQADIMISGATGANMNAAAGDDVINGGTGSDTITGGEGVDTITGGAGDDTFNMTTTANDAADRIDGGTGDDTIAISAGSSFVFNTDDTVVTNVEFVTVGSAGSVTLSGQTEGFTVNAGGGNETVVGSEGADSISGSLGNDVVTGGAGADTIDGGAGTDTVSYADITTATSHGILPASGLTGVAVNLSAAEVINATIAGGVGTGLGAGVVGDGGTGVAAGSAAYLAAAAVADIANVDTLRNVETVIGSALNDFIALGAGGMTATGGAGTDALIGGSGNDTLNADFTDLAIAGGAGTDTAVFTAAGVMAAGVMTGVENVSLSGAGTFDFSAHAEAAVYTTGNDATIFIGATTVANTVTTGDAADNVTGGNVVDTISTGAGNDTINGGTGNDIINAGAGNDQITMDDNDVVTGGAGRDTFVMTTNVAHTEIVTITDFEVGIADALDLTTAAAVAAATDIASATVQTNFATAVAINGLTAESYQVSADGVITFFDEAATFGTTELIARSTADITAISTELLVALVGDAAIFKLDEDGDGVAESSVIYNASGTELIKLIGVTADTGLNVTATAGDIHII